jgi:hypothetical protein
MQKTRERCRYGGELQQLVDAHQSDDWVHLSEGRCIADRLWYEHRRYSQTGNEVASQPDAYISVCVTATCGVKRTLAMNIVESMQMKARSISLLPIEFYASSRL